MNSIAQIIKELPTLIIYLVPGYMILWTLNYTLSREMAPNNHLVFKSLALSYLLIQISNLITQKYLDRPASIITLLVWGPIIGYGLGRILKTQWFKKFLHCIGINRSIHENFLNDIIDDEKGVWVTVYLKDKIYLGKIRKYEEKRDMSESYIVLSNWIKFDLAGEEKENHEENNDFRVLIKLKASDRIELQYHPESVNIK